MLHKPTKNLQMKTNYHSFFSQPKYIVGLRALDNIPIELDGYGAKRPMVITNKLNKKKFFHHLVSALTESNVTIAALIDDIDDYVNIEKVEKIEGLYQWRKCDSIIALGGKEIVDYAKTLGIAVSKENSIKKMDIKVPLAPIFYITTPYVNTNEVTPSVNIDGVKLISDFLYPEIVCIDKRMISSNILKSDLIFSAFHSLASCIEGVSLSQNNPFVDTSAFTAIQLIAENLPEFLIKPNSKKANLALMNGIAIASTVMANTQGGSISLSSGIISKEIDLPQGMISGLLLPIWIHYAEERNMNIREDLLLALCGIDKYCSIPKESKLSEVKSSIERIRNLASDYIPINLKSINFQEYKLEVIATEVEKQSNSVFKKEVLNEFLTRAFTGLN